MNEDQLTDRILALTEEIEQYQEAIAVAGDKRRHLMVILYEQHGWTLRKIAKLCGISAERVSQLVGHRTP